MTSYVSAASGPPSNRYNTTFLKASQFVETDEAYKGNAIQDRKIQDRGTQINFRLNLKRDFSFLLQLKFLDGLTAFFLTGFFLLFLFSFTFFFIIFFYMYYVDILQLAMYYMLFSTPLLYVQAISFAILLVTLQIAFFLSQTFCILGSLQGISSCYIHCFLAGLNIKHKPTNKPKYLFNQSHKSKIRKQGKCVKDK